MHPRACGCTFCRKHGAAYVSDPSGYLSLVARERGALLQYRQGSDIARFLLCRHCGVLLGVAFDHDGRSYGAVNAGCLDGEPGLGEVFSASPQDLEAKEKMARWLQLWVPDVVLPNADD